jgi:polyferredoxin
MQSVRVMEKQMGRLVLILIGLSITLAIIARHFPASLSTPIPVANFYDRASESSANSIYFIGMYVVVAIVVPYLVAALRLVAINRPTMLRRLFNALLLTTILGFCAYICVFMPATTEIGGGRSSLLLIASARWPIVQGAIYGLLFYVMAFFMSMLILTIDGRR